MKTTKKTKIVSKTESPTDLYKITLSVNEQTLTKETLDIAQALRDMIPSKVATKARVFLEYQGRVAEKFLRGAMEARKVLHNKTYAELFIRHLKIGLR